MSNVNTVNIKYSLVKLSFLLFGLMFGLFLVQVVIADDRVTPNDSDYSLGMQAYMLKDYERAQAHWLNAAKQNDAKSMFNLGLLHERGQISAVDMDKAENWYRLAGKHGYATADYYLATLMMANSNTAQNQSEQIKELLERSANNGFAPARIALQDLVGETPSPLPQKKYLSEDWITKKQPTSWTIQILAFTDKNKVHEFIDRYSLNDIASYFIDRDQNEVLYKLIYGVYRSKEEAAKARDGLASELKVHGPWLRTIASVQDSISKN